MSALIGIVLLLSVVGGYMLPSIIAKRRDHHQLIPIAIINLAFGWTVIGWIGALVWATAALRDRR